MEDASLDDFLDAGGEDAAGTGEDSGNAGANEESGDGDGTVDPASPTYQWSPDGADCEACGTAVRRRWRSEAGLVCADCKEWSAPHR